MVLEPISTWWQTQHLRGTKHCLELHPSPFKAGYRDINLYHWWDMNLRQMGFWDRSFSSTVAGPEINECVDGWSHEWTNE